MRVKMAGMKAQSDVDAARIAMLEAALEASQMQVDADANGGANGTDGVDEADGMDDVDGTADGGGSASADPP
jgi:hypothetical protein